MHSSCAMRPRPLVGATQTSAAIRCLVRTIIRHVATVVPAEGVILEHSRGDALDLTRRAESASLREIDIAQMKTTWGRRHQRRLALVDGVDVLASATQYDLTAYSINGRVRVCGIGTVLDPACASRRWSCAVELVGRLLDQAARDGADGTSLFRAGHEHQPTGFDLLP